MNKKNVIKLFMVVSAGMSLIQCLDGDYWQYEDDYERATGYQPSGVATVDNVQPISDTPPSFDPIDL